MTSIEIKNRIEEIENKIFYVRMADRLSWDDTLYLIDLQNEKKELIKELTKMGETLKKEEPYKVNIKPAETEEEKIAENERYKKASYIPWYLQ